MADQSPISFFVKLGYWDIYRLNVVLTTTVFRKFLYILGFVTVVWLALSVLMLFRPSPEQDWTVIMQNGSPLQWVLGLTALIVFVIPLLTARRVLKDERVKRGVTYQFSDSGIHVETSVSKSDLSWAAIRRVSELRSAFLVFTSPNIASMLPKRCLESAQSVADLRELFRVHVSKTKLRSD